MSIEPNIFGGCVTTLPGSGTVTLLTGAPESLDLSASRTAELGEHLLHAAAVAQMDLGGHASADQWRSATAQIIWTQLTRRCGQPDDAAAQLHLELEIGAGPSDNHAHVAVVAHSTGPGDTAGPAQILMEMLKVWTLAEARGHNLELVYTQNSSGAVQPLFLRNLTAAPTAVLPVQLLD